MKKVMLGAAALMIGAVTFAQNTSTITETGDGNVVHLDQTTTASGTNVSTVIQEFQDNDADVDQIGSNWSSVNQNGNVSAISGDDNYARVDQNGGASGVQRSTILQQGDRNDALATQTNGSSNDSKITQGNWYAGAEDNYARVNQINGDNNDSDVVQLNDNNRSLVDQEGSDNTVNLEQNSSPNQSRGNSSQIGQLGNENYAYSRQKTDQSGGTGFSNREIVSQTGDQNYSKLVQDGDDNFSRVTQDDSGLGGASTWYNRADVQQLNDLNTSTINQDGEATVATNNYAKVRQDGTSTNNTSTITQHGANSAYVNQNN